jgi:hypothetical protein
MRLGKDRREFAAAIREFSRRTPWRGRALWREAGTALEATGYAREYGMEGRCPVRSALGGEYPL